MADRGDGVGEAGGAAVLEHRVDDSPAACAPVPWRAVVAPALLVAGFLLAFALPFEDLPASGRLGSAVREALVLLHDYAHSHVLLCLVPALFIAGALGVLLSRQAVLRWLGPRAPRAVAFGVASVAGVALAACSCTVLPLFAGIRRRGAGLGPAVTFLYAGPAINLLAVILTFDVLGWRLGVARAVGAVVLSIVVGFVMDRGFPEERGSGVALPMAAGADHAAPRSARQDLVILGSMIAVLVFANWRAVSDHGIGAAIHSIHWPLTGISLAVAVLAIGAWTRRDEIREWLVATWDLTRKMLPLLALGILGAGFLLGRAGHPGLLPEEWVTSSVGGEGLLPTVVAAVLGAAMYLATLTEVPILQSLLGHGMGNGPALALLLAGPALSLPNVLVIRSVLGTKRTACYVGLVVVLSTLAGWGYGGLEVLP